MLSYPILQFKNLNFKAFQFINLKFRFMKQIIIIIGILSLATICGFAQTKTGLEVRNFKNNKTILIKDGAKVKIKEAGKKMKGKLKVISDQAILVNSDTILISQIQELRARTSSSLLGGLVMAVHGGVIGSAALYAIVTSLVEAGGYAIISVIVFTPLAAAGMFVAIKGVQLLINGKKFSSCKWEYKTTGHLTAQNLD